MEDRDANEFAIVLAGYYRLIVGKCSFAIIIICLHAHMQIWKPRSNGFNLNARKQQKQFFICV